MRNYIIQRVIWIFVILLTTLTITFTLFKLAPASPPEQPDLKDVWLEKQVYDGYYTVEYYDRNSAADLQAVELIKLSNEDFNKTIFIVNPINDSSVVKVFYRVPVPVQYFHWVKNIVTDWNWGTSTKIRVNVPAFDIIVEKMPITLYLNLATVAFYIPFGFFFGIIAALNKDSWIDNALQVVVMVFLSLPSLVFILLLVIIFSYKADDMLPPLFPILLHSSFWDLAKGFVIPVVAGALPAIASFTRVLRAELTEVLTSEFVLLAKTKGLSYRQAVIRHAIRNSLVPMVPIIISSFAFLLSGSFILETVYAIPGVGRVTLQALAINNYDYNVLMVSTAFYGVIALTTTLIVDLSYGIIDPRIRMGAR